MMVPRAFGENRLGVDSSKMQQTIKYFKFEVGMRNSAAGARNFKAFVNDDGLGRT